MFGMMMIQTIWLLWMITIDYWRPTTAATSTLSVGEIERQVVQTHAIKVEQIVVRVIAHILLCCVRRGGVVDGASAIATIAVILTIIAGWELMMMRMNTAITWCDDIGRDGT